LAGLFADHSGSASYKSRDAFAVAFLPELSWDAFALHFDFVAAVFYSLPPFASLFDAFVSLAVPEPKLYQV
jgi:hypothetical protein